MTKGKNLYDNTTRIFTDEEQRNPDDMQQSEFRLKWVIRNAGKIFKYTLKQFGQQGGLIKDDLLFGHDFGGENVAFR